MGDQIGKVVEGKLNYISQDEFRKVLDSELDPVEKATLFAELSRINTLYMIAKAGSGHIGTSFSSMDIMSWVFLNEVWDTNKQGNEAVFFSSKGHDAPALYNVLIGLEKLDFALIHQLRKLSGLPGHPDVSTEHVVTNTGSLGMGVSKAKGMIQANRLRGENKRVIVLTGDGELQEGQFWESLVTASSGNFHELLVIVDHNKLQSDTFVSHVSDLGNLESKFQSFGWHVRRCDGNNIKVLSATIEELKQLKDGPKVIIADTIKGKGVSFMEHTSLQSEDEYYQFHSGAPSSSAYFDALDELFERTSGLVVGAGLGPLLVETMDSEDKTQNSETQKLIGAYSETLLSLAKENKEIVALDADLVLDTGLIPFKEQIPERFIECGIAEQDMVSQAGGLALNGYLPVVHSFACFLSTRPNEQIYNNASERTKIIYVGSLAGVLPGGPGHSHQSVRDISSLGAVPGLDIVEPCCEQEVDRLLRWCVEESENSVYMRLVSIPVAVDFDIPDSPLERGKGYPVRDGDDIVVFAYGPVMLSAAIEFADAFEKRHGGMTVKVVNVPWLNYLDVEWLRQIVSGCQFIVSLDNHFLSGGFGEKLASSLITIDTSFSEFMSFGLSDIPYCGTNDEVLQAHGLDTLSLVEKVLTRVTGSGQ